MDWVASQNTSLTIVYSTVYSDADQRRHQSSASLAFVLWIHRGPVNSPYKWPVTRKLFPFDVVIMSLCVRQLTVANSLILLLTLSSKYYNLPNFSHQLTRGRIHTFNVN